MLAIRLPDARVWVLEPTLLAILPDIDAMRTMLPWILFAAMSFATALAVMKDPGDDVRNHPTSRRVEEIGLQNKTYR